MYKSLDVKAVGITDLLADGPLYTWSNNRRVEYVAKKLDMILVYKCWLQSFEKVSVVFNSRLL